MGSKINSRTHGCSSWIIDDQIKYFKLNFMIENQFMHRIEQYSSSITWLFGDMENDACQNLRDTSYVAMGCAIPLLFLSLPSFWQTGLANFQFSHVTSSLKSPNNDRSLIA